MGKQLAITCQFKVKDSPLNFKHSVKRARNTWAAWKFKLRELVSMFFGCSI